ncbi:phospholipase/carboxylesterase [Cardiosporidium cionae]|uniref:Phospholipase/carboxylesterase n=1 Tax=Cardiosporidium cionae TaxID=476202 RepID=A0ABQ7J5H7_9APIC|nr:phospholipase/carboxylesterase [Cardiosporidium cionae]|eukprot:KAF8819179.1 phospholipase/carboxylesterase [Cardiosporidium cionae]
MLPHMLWFLVLGPAAALSLFLGFLWFFQEKVIFQPSSTLGVRYPTSNPRGMKNPSEHGMDYEDVYLHSADGTRIHMWMITQPNPNRMTVPTILYLQSNAGNCGFRLPILSRFYKHFLTNIAVLSYRGYGFSSGVSTEQGIYSDAVAALQYLESRDDIHKKKIFLYGSSIGSAVALTLAQRMVDSVSGIILENPFTTLYAIAVATLPFLKWLPLLNFFMRVKMDNLSIISNLTLPLLILTGEDDTTVDPCQSIQLYKASPSKVKINLRIPKAGHNNLWEVDADRCLKEILKFIQLH